MVSSVFAHGKQTFRGRLKKNMNRQILVKHDKGSADMTHSGTATGRTYMDIIIPDFFQHCIHWQIGQHGLKTLMPLNSENDRQVVLFAPVI